MPVRVRIATYNVQSFRAGLDLPVQVLAREEPDVALVQESGPRLRLQRVAGELDMEFVSSHRPFSRVHNAVLFRPPWRVAGFQSHTLSRRGRALRRGLVMATLRHAETTAVLTAVSAHLGLVGGERERHARELTDFLAGRRGPLVLGIDLNEGPLEPAARWIAGRLYDAYARAGREGGETLPARSPTVRIDFLFVSHGVEVVDAWVPGGEAAARASDHRPVLVDVDVPLPAPR